MRYLVAIAAGLIAVLSGMLAVIAWAVPSPHSGHIWSASVAGYVTTFVLMSYARSVK